MEVGQLLTRSLVLVASTVLLVACGDDGDESTLTDLTSPSSVDAGSEVDSVAEDAPEMCDLLSDERITDSTGVSVHGIEGEADTCTWSLTESAAVLGGPNEGGEASLEATFIDPDEFASFEASDEPGIDVVTVDDVGDEAFLVRRNGLPPSTLFVLDGDRALELSLANLFDGDNATELVLSDLAREILRPSDVSGS